MHSNSPEPRLGTTLTVARAAGVFKRLNKIFDDDVLEENKARALRIPTVPSTPTTTMPPMHRVSLRSTEPQYRTAYQQPAPPACAEAVRTEGPVPRVKHATHTDVESKAVLHHKLLTAMEQLGHLPKFTPRTESPPTPLPRSRTGSLGTLRGKVNRSMHHSDTRSTMHTLPLAVGSLADARRCSDGGALVGPPDEAAVTGGDAIDRKRTASLAGSDVSHVVETELFEALEDAGAASVAPGKKASFLIALLGDSYMPQLHQEMLPLELPAPRVGIRPTSTFRYHWDMSMAAAMLYVCFVIPIQITFGSTRPGPWLALDLVLSLVFVSDILVNLNTGLLENGRIVMDRKTVRTAYLRRWLPLDVVSAIPLSAVAAASKLEGAAAVALRVPNMIRLIKLPQTLSNLGRWEDLLPVNTFQLRIAKLAFFIILFLHLAACAQVVVGTTSREPFSRGQWMAELGIVDAGPLVQYTAALLRALACMLSIGTWTQPPMVNGDVVMYMLIQLLGTVLFLSLFGNITYLMKKADTNAAHYTDKLQMWKDYGKARRLPREHRRKAEMTLHVHWMATRLLPEAALLQDINPIVRTDLCMHNHRALVQQAPLFRLISAAATREVISRLLPAWYALGDTVFTQGSIAAEMFFVHAGTVCLRTGGPDAERLTDATDAGHRGRLQRLTDRLAQPVVGCGGGSRGGLQPQQVLLAKGAHFGEGALLQGVGQVRAADAVAATACEVLVLTAASFHVVASHYPEVRTIPRGVFCAIVIVCTTNVLQVVEALRVLAGAHTLA